MRLLEKEKLLFIGDSITDCGRAQPAGEGLFDALGKGYVAQVDALLGAIVPQLGIRVVNQGISGNTARDLKHRWERDVLAHHPDWLAIMIGINDVWRQFIMPRQPETHVLPEEYQTTLDDLIAHTKPNLKGLVLMTPFYIEPNKQDPMRARMDQYGAIVKKLATKHNAICVDVQAAFDQVMQSVYGAAMALDRVHPNQVGHMVIARAFLDGVGLQW